jgi:hypothetical protein
MASKPVANTTLSNVKSSAAVRSEVDEADVVTVVGGVVAGVDADPLRADGVTLGAEHLGHGRVAHGLFDLGPDEVGHDLVGRPVEHRVGEGADEGEAAPGPPGLQRRPALRLGVGGGPLVGGLEVGPEETPPVLLAVLRVPLLEIPEGVGVEGVVVGRHAEVRGPLEDDQVTGLFGDQRDGLDGR